MGKKSSGAKVYDYLASIHYAICQGPIDAVYRIRARDTDMWIGSAGSSQHIAISDDEMFGGDTSEGGAEGTVELTMGSWEEAPSPALAARLGLALAEMPAYRGLATLFFRGVPEPVPTGVEVPKPPAYGYVGIVESFEELLAPPDPENGFWWGTNNFYIPGVDVTVGDWAEGPGTDTYAVIWPYDEHRHDARAYQEGLDAGLPGYTEEGLKAIGLKNLPSANPAYIIYEALTDIDMGAQIDPARIDGPSFIDAAQRLYEEKLGMSLMWTRQTSVESFVQEIVDTIQAYVFPDPETGKYTLRLLREDISFATGRVITPDNASMVSRKFQLQDTTTNEIVVSYTDPDSEETRTVTVQSLGSIARLDGRVISSSRDYKGLRNPEIATVVGNRDLAQLSVPLYTATIRGDRSFWDLRPGDTALLQWPEDGIASMTVRVQAVNRTGSEDSGITFDVVQDVFSAKKTRYRDPQLPLGQPVKQLPRNLPVQMPVTLPFPSLQRLLGLTEPAVDALWPQEVVGFIADDPGRLVTEIRVVGPRPEPEGGSSTGTIVTISPSASRQTVDPLVQQARSYLSKALVRSLATDAKPGMVLMLGEPETETAELVMLLSYDSGTERWQILRGLWDTQPRVWPELTRISIFPRFKDELDPYERVGGVNVNYRFRPRVEGKMLAESNASIVSFTPLERAVRPFRPANCQLDGQGFLGVNYLDPPVSVVATWANRNRLREDQSPPDWTAASVTPESGQTTTLRIYDDLGTLVHEEAGLTGTSHTIPVADFGGATEGVVHFLSERDGYESFPVIRSFRLQGAGWGRGYGLDYGG